MKGFTLHVARFTNMFTSPVSSRAERRSRAVDGPFVLVLLLLCSFASAQQKQAKPAAKAPVQKQTQQAPVATPSIAIRGGKVMTVTHGTIDNGVVVMENGKITAVGAAGSVTIPKNAKVIDATGMTVYPGLIDSFNHLGLTEVSAVDMTNDLQEPSDEIMPHMHVADAFHAETELIPVTRLNGITNSIVAPETGDTLPGQMAFIQLDGHDSDDMLKINDIALQLNFSGDQRRNKGGFQNAKYPSTRMGLAAQLRQAFIDAQDYATKWADYEKKQTGESKPSDDKDKKSEEKKATPPKRDLKLEALVPYVQGKKPILLTANEASDVKVALRLAQEFNLKVILCGLEYSQKLFDQIAATKYPVIIGSIYDTPKANERYDEQYSVPAQLAKRGIKIAFASYDAHQVRNLPYAAGYAVAFGLPYEEAIKALTINPAEIWGIADQYGSLDVGKVANVVIANGDPLDVKTDVKQVFIAGREIPMVSKQTALRDAYSKR
jgi:imidazolonepropionase-like amidohydrolase